MCSLVTLYALQFHFFVSDLSLFILCLLGCRIFVFEKTLICITHVTGIIYILIIVYIFCTLEDCPFGFQGDRYAPQFDPSDVLPHVRVNLGLCLHLVLAHGNSTALQDLGHITSLQIFWSSIAASCLITLKLCA